MKKILIVKTGGTFEEYAREHGDFEDWVANGMKLEAGQWTAPDVRKGEILPDPDQVAGCVVTGSHDMVTDDKKWIRTTSAWLRTAVESGLPVLGICFGHQMLADALGGKAGYHPNGLEIGTTTIARTDLSNDDPLFKDLPKAFPGHVTHAQTVLGLPPHSTLLATGSHDPHQAFRVGKHAWGIQFHPEFDASSLSYYIDRREENIRQQGLHLEAIRSSVVNTPDAASLLPRFMEYCRGLQG